MHQTIDVSTTQKTVKKSKLLRARTTLSEPLKTSKTAAFLTKTPYQEKNKQA